MDTCGLCSQMRGEAEVLKARIESLREAHRRLIELHLEHHQAVSASRAAPIEERIPTTGGKTIRKLLFGY